jgi:hypothetical protein
VSNPSTYTTAYISGVYSITASSGTVPSLSSWTQGAATPAYAPGVQTAQDFSLPSGQYIYTSSTDSTGGGATISSILFTASGYTSPYTPSPLLSFTIAWSSIGQTITLTSLDSSIVFLKTYTSATWTTSISGVASLGTITTQSIVQTNGDGTTITPASSFNGNGTMTFGTPICKGNTSLATLLQFNVTYRRPVNIRSGSTYDVTVTATSSSVNSTATFKYPSFWLFKQPGVPVSLADVVSGTDISPQNLSDKVKSFSGFVTNPQAYTQTFWFGVLASASQPTSFASGSSSGLTVSVTPTQANIDLFPNPLPTGWGTTVTYTLYGWPLTPGQSYVIIS